VNRAIRYQNSKSSKRDSVRVLLALVFILFASLASRDHESPEVVLPAQDAAQFDSQFDSLASSLASSLAEPQVQAQALVRPARVREAKRIPKIPESAILSRINGSI
jgi:hypothetical protein